MGSAGNQSLAQPVASTVQGRSSHGLWQKRSRMCPGGTTGLLYGSANSERVSKANRVGWGSPQKRIMSLRVSSKQQSGG